MLISINLVVFLTSGIRDLLSQPKNNCAHLDQVVIFQQKPNIYLFILESYHGFDLRHQVYKIDNTFLKQALANRNFKIYHNIKANYAGTAPSVASIFMMKHHYYTQSKPPFLNELPYYQHVIGGKLDNNLICILKSNGYKIDFSDFISYLYRPSNLLDIETYNINYLQPLELFQGIWGLTFRLFKGFHAENFFTFVDNHLFIFFSRDINNTKKQLDNKPFFRAVYTGAFHAPGALFAYPEEIAEKAYKLNITDLWKINDEVYKWKDVYRNKVIQSDIYIVKMIDKILETDNNSLILLTGDHGAYRLTNSWIGSENNPTSNILKNGFTPEEVTNDWFDIFLAVRYKGAEIDLSNSSPVNYFNRIFNTLANNSTLFKDLSNDSFFRINSDVYQTVDNGIILDSWREFTPPPKTRN